MKNRLTIFIAIGLVCAIVLALLYYSFTPEDPKLVKEDTKKKKIERKQNDWDNTKTDHQSLDPYGYFIFYHLLKNQHADFRTLRFNSQYKSLDTINVRKRLYVFVGAKFKTHEKRVDKVLDFVNRGNDALICADLFPDQVKKIIEDHYSVKTSVFTNIDVNFTDSALRVPYYFKIRFVYKRKTKERFWTSFERTSNYYSLDSTNQTPAEVTVYETNVNTFNPVYISIPYGKGHLYLSSLPYSLTNIALNYESGIRHAERIIACLPQDKPIIYDTYINKHPQDVEEPGDPSRRSSPLEFILANKPLRWAYYIILFGLVLYILFKSKRRQRIIPAHEEVENNSVEFADTMSKLYLQYGQHKYIVFQQERNLLNYIRNKYYIKTMKVDDEYIERVAIKSGIDKARLTNLFNRFAGIKRDNFASSNDVVQIYAEIEHFYKNCK